MDVVLKRNLILLTTVIYLFFACSYVLLCKRDNGVINLFSCFYSTVSGVKTSTSPIIKTASANPSPLSHKFLSRPRVVINRLLLANFAVVAIVLLSVFNLNLSSKRSSLQIIIKHSTFRRPDLAFYHNWRI
jgi:hypothetical protein